MMGILIIFVFYKRHIWYNTDQQNCALESQVSVPGNAKIKCELIICDSNIVVLSLQEYLIKYDTEKYKTDFKNRETHKLVEVLQTDASNLSHR